MVNNFKLAYAFTSKWEGGYVNDPSDPGGETKYGISKRAYPDVDIKSLTKIEAEKIYYNDYWLKGGCDTMDKDLAIVYFDACVNAGIGRAKGWLVKAREKTQGRDDEWCARLFNQERIAYYNNLVKVKPTLMKFHKGWLNRVNDLAKYIDMV
jgi:lysozyme family protein